MTHNSHLPVRVGKIHCQGHQDPSKRVTIFLGTHVALIKMVPIGGVPIPDECYGMLRAAACVDESDPT
jgi:hypothetical protein